jgi:RNA polymerase sigma factor (sigma-70 family)
LSRRRAEDEVVRRYEPLVQHVVWRLKLPPWCEREDLAQEARLALVTAMREWRPERGAFPAFAQQCVKNETRLAVISTSRHKHQVLTFAVSIEGNFADDSSAQHRPLRLLDRLATTDDAETDPELHLVVREQIDSVLHALPTLTAAERAAMSGRLSDQTSEQVAQPLM